MLADNVFLKYGPFWFVPGKTVVTAILADLVSAGDVIEAKSVFYIQYVGFNQ